VRRGSAYKEVAEAMVGMMNGLQPARDSERRISQVGFRFAEQQR
jgi:hypothetical protein